MAMLPHRAALTKRHFYPATAPQRLTSTSMHILTSTAPHQSALVALQRSILPEGVDGGGRSRGASVEVVGEHAHSQICSRHN
jgi:hypothetical protein